jgi:TM2 domain-containing membrane protein YozV
MRVVILAFCLIGMCLRAWAAGPHLAHGSSLPAEVVEILLLDLPDSVTGPPHERLTASLLALTLGPFGAHRLYFGTVPKVPIIYGITFGGFGVLVLIDLGHILFTKDLSPYRSNDKVFMWGKARSAPTPP